MGTSVTFSTSGSEWEIIKSGETSVFYNNDDTDPYLRYTKVSGSCSTLYECTMSNKVFFHEMMKKIFAESPLQTYESTSSYQPGLNKSEYVGSNSHTKLSYDNHLILEYNPNRAELQDNDDPKQPIVTYYPCAETFGKTTISGGSGGGGGGEQDQQNILFRGVTEGDNGYSGSGGVDGDFYEDDEVESIPYPKDHEHNGQIHFVRNIEQHEWLTINLNKQNKTLQCIVESEFSEIEQPLELKLFGSSGQLISTSVTNKNSTDIVIQSTGIYFLVVKKGNKMETRKVFISYER